MTIRVTVAFLSILSGFNTVATAASVETPLYVFQRLGDGVGPLGGVAINSAGSLFGTTTEGGSASWGTIFEIDPPESGGSVWTETLLHSFQGSQDGASPYSGLISDKEGNLYGTTYGYWDNPSDHGTIFRVTPPTGQGGNWTEAPLYVFQGKLDGGNPSSQVTKDSQGDLYGATTRGGTYGYGTFFELVAPRAASKQWKIKVLYSFPGGDSGYSPSELTSDPQGNYYGVMDGGGVSNNGVAFEMVRPTAGTSSWEARVIYYFKGGKDGSNPNGAMTIDATGSLFGTTMFGGTGFGTLFKLVPPAAGKLNWSENVLLRLKGGSFGFQPSSALIQTKNGTLYSTTPFGGSFGYGLVFKLVPPAAGKTAWREKVLWSFNGPIDGATPSNLIYDKLTGLLFGETSLGISDGNNYNNGTVFSISP